MAAFTGGAIYTTNTAGGAQVVWGDFDSHVRSLGGWTYVAQTGDSDFASQITVSGTYYFRVYSTTFNGETWYMRIDVGFNADGPTWKVQFGTSVNGSGVLGGQTSTQWSQVDTGGSNASANTLFISAAAGRLMFWLGKMNDVRNIGLSVHAAVDANGDPLSGLDAFYLGTSSLSSQAVPLTGTVPPLRGYWPCNFGQEADTTIGSVIPTGHPFLWTTTGARFPSPAVAVGGSSNSTSGLSTVLTVYGQSRTYLSLVNVAGGALAGSSNNKPLFLFD